VGSPTDVVLMVFRDCYSAQWKDHDRLHVPEALTLRMVCGGFFAEES